MEPEIVQKLRLWVDHISDNNLSVIIPELKEYLKSNASRKSVDKVAFKLLQYLSHAAYEYSRSKTKLGIDLARLATLICYNLSTIPHWKKFFSSTYHIISSLLEMGLYVEAEEVCDQFLNKLNVCQLDDTITKTEILESISSLWYKIGSNLLKNVDSKRCKTFKQIIKYEFYLFALMKYTSYNRVSRMLSYYKRIILESDAIYKENLIDTLLKTAEEYSVLFDSEKSDSTWIIICDLIAKLIGKDINAKTIEKIRENHRRYFELFGPSINAIKKYSIIFSLWERLCGILLKPIAQFTKDCVAKMNSWLKEFNDALELLDPKTVKPYCDANLHLFTLILRYWEEYIKSDETDETVHVDVIVAMLNLSKKHSELTGNFERLECHCRRPDCTIKKDTSNELVIKIKCLALISHSSTWLTTKSIRKIVEDLIKISLKLLKALKEGGCEQWLVLWPPWGAAVYNMGVTCENSCPSASIEFYSSLYKSIVSLEGVKGGRRLWGFDDPLGTVLHRLTSVYIKSEEYSRARKIASINCLLSLDIVDSKAYRDWLNIKLKDSEEKEMNVVRYLRSNEFEIPTVSLDDYDLVKVCLREMKTLQESQADMSKTMFSILEEIDLLKPSPLEYAEAVQLMTYDLLNFDTELSLRTYIGKVCLMFEREKSPSLHFRCAHAMAKFYEFVEKAQWITRKTETNMNNALLALMGRTKNSATVENPEYEVVPAYTAINMSVTSDLEACLKRAFARWREILDLDYRKYANDWQIRYTLHAIKIAGEYCRLYHFEYLESQAWRMVYAMAHNISDSLSVVYATCRNLTSHNFNPDWILKTEAHVASLEDSHDRETMDILTRYRLCLANFYYENNEIERADEIFLRATSNGQISFMQDFSNFLLVKEIEMKHRLGRDGNDHDQSDYTNMIVEFLYTLLSIGDSVENVVHGHKEKQLYDFELLFEFTNSLSLRLNSLLSYREISAHLVKRLGGAQKLVTSLRVAECLKYLCYIDLSRAKLEDCEVKIQGLEHILEIEAFDVTMRSKLSPTLNYQPTARNFTSPTRDAGTIPDIGQSDASPVLRKKVFSKPDFMLHEKNCSCLKCTNSCYHYLVFSATHIRAQLFALQGNEEPAFQHFHGAMKIRKWILMREEADIDKLKNKKPCLCPKHQSNAIEYIMFRLDYCRFVTYAAPAMEIHVRDITLDALESCEEHNLYNHPIYKAVNEFIFQCQFNNIFTENNYSRFVVPDIDKIDDSRYERTSADVCKTPVHEILEMHPIYLKRRKTPPVLKLERVPISFTDETPNAPNTPTIPNFSTKTRRRVRRKICDEEAYSIGESTASTKSEEVSAPRIIVSSQPSDFKSTEILSKRKFRRNNTEEKSNDVTEVTKMLASTQIGSKRKTRSTKKMQATQIQEVTELLNDMSMDKQSGSLSTGSVTSELVTVTQENDENSLGSRSSLRLRVRTSAQSKNAKSESTPIILAPDSSEDELVVGKTRSTKRLLKPKEQNANNKVERSTRTSRSTSKDA